MASGAGRTKRKLTPDGAVSPPPVRRKVQSMTTQNAVSSFFTPLSKKPPEKTVWHERAPNDDIPSTLLVGRYEPHVETAENASGHAPQQRRKVAAFDFDSTLIQTVSGKKHASEAQDWKWWHPSVPGILRNLYMDEGYLIAIVSNQGGIPLKKDPKLPKSHQARVAAFKEKVSAVLNQLNIPVSIYAATEKDIYRKPRTGMWDALLDDNDLNATGSIDLNESFFVGDAGGRVASIGLAKDFSSSDRDFASNVGIAFHAPEEFFLKQAPRAFCRTFQPTSFITASGSAVPIARQLYLKRNEKDIILFCGSPGAGKSTFFWTHLEHLKYERINQDILKSREKCIKVADVLLSEGKSVAIDNTNADKEVRSKWVELGLRHNVPVRCVLFLAEPELCEHNSTVRALNCSMNPEKRDLLPKQAFLGFNSRFQRPELSEGFQDITVIKFQFQGTQVEQDIWSKYWT